MAGALHAFRQDEFEAAAKRSNLVRKFGALFGERAITSVSLALTSVLAARILSVDAFATVAFAAGVFALLSPLLDTGQPYLLRLLVENPNSAFRQLTIAISLSLIMGVPTMLFVTVAVMSRPDNLQFAPIAVIASCVGLVVRPLVVVEYFLQSNGRISTLARVRISASVIGLAVRLLALTVMPVGSPQIALFAAASSIELLTAAFCYARVLWASKHRNGGPVVSLCAYFRNVLPFLLTAVAVVLYLRIDTVMLGYLGTSGDVASYAAAVRISEAGYLVATALGQVLGRRLVRPGQRDFDALAQMEHTLTLFVWTSIPIAISGIAFASLAVQVLFGPTFVALGTVTVLQVHLLALPLVFAGTWQQYVTAADGTGAAMAWRTWIAAAVNIVGNAYAIPRYGALGAASVTVVSYLLSAVLLNLASSRTRQVGIMQAQAFNPFSAPGRIRSAAHFFLRK